MQDGNPPLEKAVKLGTRLQQIASMVADGYDHIWDCCCDHGLLGAALLARAAAPQIHFVDIVPALMNELREKLERFFPERVAAKSHWHLHCMDVAALPLQQLGGKHLVIIAGVGGDLMAELVAKIVKENPLVEMDFLLCPVHHQFTLRAQLIDLQLKRCDEKLVEENNRYYEILWVTTAKNNPLLGNSLNAIHPVGDLIWQAATPAQTIIAQHYLQKTLAHYQRMQLNPEVDAQLMLAAYREVRVTSLVDE